MSENSICILVVDDETAIRDSLSAYLEDRGCEVYSASSGEEALEIFEKQCNIEICSIDMRLPGMDGNTLILKSHELRPETVYMIYTGSTDYQLPQSLLDIGVNNENVFHKPMDNLLIIENAIRSLIAQRRGENNAR